MPNGLVVRFVRQLPMMWIVRDGPAIQKLIIESIGPINLIMLFVLVILFVTVHPITKIVPVS